MICNHLSNMTFTIKNLKKICSVTRVSITDAMMIIKHVDITVFQQQRIILLRVIKDILTDILMSTQRNNHSTVIAVLIFLTLENSYSIHRTKSVARNMLRLILKEINLEESFCQRGTI